MAGFLAVSIHAPLAGRDLSDGSTLAHLNSFQSTRPSRGATITGKPFVAIPLMRRMVPEWNEQVT